MRRLTPCCLVLAGLLLTAAPAAAAPRILSATVEGSPLAGEPLTVAVVATDPRDSINGVTVAFPDDTGAGQTACLVGRDGRPRRTGALAVGRDVRFRVPYRPQTAGVHVLKVTVTAGACEERSRSTSISLSVQVGLADLPSLPRAPAPAPGAVLPAGSGGNGSAPVAAASAACRDAHARPTRRTLRRIRAAVLCLVNAERRARGLRGVRTDKRLRRAASRHARDMRRRGYFGHAGPGGPDLATRLSRARYWPAVAGENIGYGGGVLATPAGMIDAWMRSDPHRMNVLTASFRHLGVGVISRTPGGAPGATYVGDFGSR